ncbi:hypothetical protein C8J57DRAFT_1407811 [Mycena rebaudengoi]|nr:hypothetical protein C8J57DRAFT_1407811 [Mycena rebaudengoi]
MRPSAWATLSSSSVPQYPMLLAHEIPRRSDSALALEPSLRPTPAAGVRVDVLLFADACAGSEWRGLCDGDATQYRDDGVACSPPAVWDGWMEREDMREEVREVEAVRRGMEVGDTVQASCACATTHGDIACGGVARACDVARDNERSGQRDVRGDVTRDRQRCCRIRASRGIGGCVPNVPWDTGGASCLDACDTARNNERGGERGVRAACGGRSPMVSPCMLTEVTLRISIHYVQAYDSPLPT